MTHTLLHLVTTYGYAGVALLVMLEGLGFPVPGETALIMAAAFAAQGSLSIVGVVLAAALGTIAGGTGGYLIGREGGFVLLQRYGRWLRLSEARLDTAHQYFHRHGAKTVFVGRFVALLRIVVSLLAGVARMPFATFSTYNALGGVSWSLVYGGIGYLFGRNLPRLERGLGRAGFVVALLVALIVVVVLVWRWMDEHREELWRWARRVRLRLVPALSRLEAQHVRARGYIVQRFTPGEYLVLHLTLGIVASLLALVLFASITEGVFEPGTLARFDMALAVTVHQAMTSFDIAAARVVSTFGSAPVMSVLGIGVAVVLALGRRPLLCGAWIAALVGSAILTGVLEMLVRRPRPDFAAPLGARVIWSFPSAHVLGALVAFGLLAYLVGRAVPGRRWRTALWAGAVVLTIAIGVSRLALGVHSFSGIIVGSAAGAVWLGAVVSGLEVARRRKVSQWVSKSVSQNNREEGEGRREEPPGASREAVIPSGSEGSRSRSG
ncbi:MAG TPA: bifunctional DedA family/phosphatase PAP2 family protein [Gemmatimonadaceae bacterium]